MKRKCILAIILSCAVVLTGCFWQKDEKTSEQEVVETQEAEEEQELDESQEVEPEEEEIEEPIVIEENKACIVIDAGHQRVQNSEHEPIGPGASQTKMKVSSGTAGIVTGTPEYVVNLQVAQRLERILKENGYEVIMVRQDHDVNISNRERAEVANQANADAFLRIHCNGSENRATNGALTLCPDDANPYCSYEVIQDSLRLSEMVLQSLCEATGARQLSMIRTSTMSGINWCQVPVSIVEMGFMSNAEEDRKLNDEQYQEKLAQGIANGVIQYLEERR